MSFLSDLSKNIVSSGIPLQETVVVLPNERARRMLLEQLSHNLQLPAFVPAIFSIEHFISQLSPLKTLGKLELLTALFETVKNMEPPVVESFDEMLTWAPAYLSDIDEIDMQLQDGKYVFKTLAFDKEFTIAMANPDQKETLNEKMAFYARLAELYILFRDHLRMNKQAYNGLKFRDCAENIAKYAKKINFKHFIFAGFHVFTPSELSVVRYLKDNFDTQFFFDVDSFYCDFNQDERFTTAYFLRKICAELNMQEESIQYVGSDYETIPKHIQIVGVSKDMNQIYYAIQQLRRIEAEQGSLDGTAVVLADEHLLIPFLSAFGKTDVNVTMGYPLLATPVYTLLNSLIDLYQTALRYSHGGVMRFHHQDVVAVFRNSLVRQCLFEDESEYEDLVANIENNQRALYTYADLPVEYLPAFSAETDTLLPALARYFDQLFTAANKKGLDVALLQMMVDTLNNTCSILNGLSQNEGALKLSTIKYALGLQLDHYVLTIKGEPLHGLQVMGLLETRTLDFKHVIMLSVNEGVLPAGISYNTLLPFEIKYDNHSLPNYLYKDQVYAYHFFRLLQRAEDVVLLYNNVSDTSLMEKSRFITQLEFLKKEKKLENITLEYPQVGFQFKASVPECIEVKKSDELLRKLRGMRYSATALNHYISCPLQFYFSDVCRIEPRQTFQEKIESKIIGTVVHALLEDVFNRIKDNPDDYHGIIHDYIDHVEESISEKLLNDNDLGLHLTPYELAHGRIYLACRMIYNDVCNYLHKAAQELDACQAYVVGNEIRIESSIQVDGCDVLLYGVIDRLQISLNEENKQIPVVIDYKTGYVDDKGLQINMSEMDRIFQDSKYKQAMQLLFYALLLKLTNKAGQSSVIVNSGVQCGILCIKDVNKGLNFPEYWHPLVICGDDDKTMITQEALSAYEGLLKSLLQEILNQENSFVQTTEEDHCRYCNFRQICRRG